MGSQASLDRKPGSNWVEADPGGLPGFVREVARAIERESGHSLDRALPEAISQITKWAAQGNPKAVKALAEWRALKARNKARTGTKGNKVEASAALERVVELSQRLTEHRRR